MIYSELSYQYLSRSMLRLYRTFMSDMPISKVPARQPPHPPHFLHSPSQSVQTRTASVNPPGQSEETQRRNEEVRACPAKKRRTPQGNIPHGARRTFHITTGRMRPPRHFFFSTTRQPYPASVTVPLRYASSTAAMSSLTPAESYAEV